MMKIALSVKPLSKTRGGLVVAVVDPKQRLFESDDSEVGQALAEAHRAFGRGRYHRELVRRVGKGASSTTVVVFSSELEKVHGLPESVKIFAAKALGYASDYACTHLSFLLNGASGGEYVGCAVEGFVLGNYRFDKYRKDRAKGSIAVSIVCRSADRKRAALDLKRARLVSDEVNRARDLVNEPGDKVYPKTLATMAKSIARASGLGVSIVSGRELDKKRYNGLVAVGKGSVYPPCLIVLRYRPQRASKRHLALVGKGITFDTGGISIKPSEGMWTMKGDMAGGAAVIGAMAAIAKRKPKIAVTGIVAAAENFPGPDAQRPGDIFVANNGKSIMVDNTDAEGRLVLTDALARAGEEGATHIVDAATLTGSVVRALGTSVAGIMGNDPDLVRAVIESGARHGEAFWELPLVEEYRDLLKTPFADLNNIGGKFAGAITAGLFLREFVPPGAKWVHLDIAGPFILEKKWKYYPEGATGFAVKTFVDLAESL